MELKLENGDYLPDGHGGLQQAEEELLQRADWLYHVSPHQKYAAITAVVCWRKFLM